MLQFRSIRIGEGSTCACLRCHTPVPPSYFSATAIIESIGSTLASTQEDADSYPNVVLTGPEPFGHPSLPMLVNACVQAGARRIALETDGGALCAHGNAEGVLYAGVTHLWVRVLGVGKLGDELAGHPGLSASAEAGLHSYLEAAQRNTTQVAVTALVPVCQHNLASLPSTVAALARWGLHGARLVMDGSGVAMPASAAAVIAAACDTGMVNGLWVEADTSVPVPETHRLHVARSEVADV